MPTLRTDEASFAPGQAGIQLYFTDRTLTGKPDESFGDVHSEATNQILRTARTAWYRNVVGA